MRSTITRAAGLAGGVTASLLALLTTVPARAETTNAARTSATAASAATSTVATSTAAASTVAASTVRAEAGSMALPAPTGPRPVGTVSLHLVDRGRPDPWVPTEKARELMVSLWYPAAKGGGATAAYMTVEEAKALLEGQKVTGTPAEAVSGIRTHAVTGARPAGRRGTLPLVVLSPGFTMPRSSLTALAEELASRGYVVAGIDHVHESFGTSLPGGRFADCAACEEQESDGWKFGDKAIRSRQADVSFVLDHLLGRHPAWKGARLVDRSRVGMAGHSLGGASAPWTMLKDPRVRAGVNMDGTFFVPLPEQGLKRPFMLMGAGEVHEPGGEDFTWDRDWARTTGWKRWITLEGGDHGSFTDYPLMTKQSGREPEITRAYVAAFMDRNLRGEDEPLLDGPSGTFPEIRFWH